MREEELIALVRKIQRRQTEFQTVELKAAHVDFPKKIYDTLSSFSNGTQVEWFIPDNFS